MLIARRVKLGFVLCLVFTALLQGAQADTSKVAPPFRSAGHDEERNCSYPYVEIPPALKPTCSTDVSATLDGIARIELQIQTPASGLLPGSGSVSGWTTFEQSTLVLSAPRSIVYTVTISIDSISWIDETKLPLLLGVADPWGYITAYASDYGCAQRCRGVDQLWLFDASGRPLSPGQYTLQFEVSDSGAAMPPGSVVLSVDSDAYLSVADGLIPAIGQATLSVHWHVVDVEMQSAE